MQDIEEVQEDVTDSSASVDINIATSSSVQFIDDSFQDLSGAETG